jgi:hypothetical protein
MLAVLRALDRQEIDELIELFEPAAEEFFEQIFGGLGGWEEYPDEIYVDDYSTVDDSSGDMTDVAEVADEPAEVSGWERCYEEVAAVDATACFQQYVATGEIDATFIPVALRFPECGYAEVSWSGAVYSLPDAEFVATVEAARPCFQALVAAGTIQDYELPTEIAHLECFEGRNWYNVLDDPEYDARYYACVEAKGDA